MKKIICILILCFLPAILLAEAESLTLTFSLEDFTFSKQNIYDVINPPQNENYVMTTRVGEPQLPVKIINLYSSAGATPKIGWFPINKGLIYSAPPLSYGGINS